MASGVLRPYTVQDVLGSLQDQVGALSAGQTTSAGTGHFSEADEAFSLSDTVTVTGQANPAWNAGYWGQFSWS